MDRRKSNVLGTGMAMYTVPGVHHGRLDDIVPNSAPGLFGVSFAQR